MQELFLKKDKVVNQLQAVSALMLEYTRRGDITKSTEQLAKRDALLGELEAVDEEIGRVPSPYDRDWLFKIRKVQDMDAKMQFEIELRMAETDDEARQQGDARVNLVNEHLLPSKGLGVEAKG